MEYSNEVVSLVEQVLNEGRFRDKAINVAKNSEYDLENAIKTNDTKKVKRLAELYTRALNFIREAKSQKNVNKYWSLPNWLIFLIVPFPLSAGVNAIINKDKTKFTKEELDSIEQTLKLALEKANNFLASQYQTKHEAACILIEALNTLLNE